MAAKKILLLYISESSGHHCASIAIENALHSIAPDIQTMNINCFNYTNPILEKVINRAYLGVVKRTPEIWDYLYDNPKVLKRTQKLRAMIHKFNAAKLKVLLNEFKPNAIICTQAFPCGMIADYKKSLGLSTPLIGVLTDYAPHSYWIYDSVDKYIVPSKETGLKLIANGIDPRKIETFGIPVESRFSLFHDKEAIFKKVGIDPKRPSVLIMGGTQGLGPIKDIIRSIDKSDLDVQAIVAAGTNKKLYSWMATKSFKKKVVVLPYADNIDELMEISTVIITKPGGITTAEALCKGLPMLIVSPLPGQESMNTIFLLNEYVAVKAENPEDVIVVLTELLYNKNKLAIMSERARSLAKPDSAVNIARLTMELTR